MYHVIISNGYFGLNAKMGCKDLKILYYNYFRPDICVGSRERLFTL